MEPLTAVAEGVWSIHHREFSVGGLAIGTRSNLFRLADGTLALHAPGPLDASHRAAILKLGDVSTIVVPNLLHHLHVGSAEAAFPEARVLAVPGIEAKQPTLRVHETFGPTPPASFAGVAKVLRLDGCPKLEEHVIFLPASGPLLAVDLAFSLRGMTGFTRFAMWLNDANDRFGMTRMGKSQYVQDAAAAGRSVARMVDAWDIERVVVAHGEVLETGGREAVRAAWAFAGG